MSTLTSSLLSAPAALLNPSPVPTASKEQLRPHDGAPLSGDRSLIPPKYLPLSLSSSFSDKEKEKLESIDTSTPSPSIEHPTTGLTTAISPRISRTELPPTFYRAPPSQLLDAPARAAMNLPNAATAHGQARAVRGADPRTPEYDLDGEILNGGGLRTTVEDASGENTPLLAPQPRYAGKGGGNNLDSNGRDDYFLSAGAGGGSSSSQISRPSSAQSTSSNRGILRRIFIDRAGTPSQHLTRPTFPPPSLSTYSPQPVAPLSAWAKVSLLANQTISVILSTFFLAFVVSWALACETAARLPSWIWPGKGKKFPWDDDRYWRKEGRKISKDPADYAKQVGMDIEHQTVETEDGYYLKMHKVIDPTHKPLPNGKPPFPVLILHGLFQSSGSFVTSEDRSLAFWLARQGGYSVYLGNTRGVFDMGHRSYARGDPRFWDWTIRELAMYDLPALVEHVCRDTGYDKIGFIGHSQGNGLAFISLSLGMCPNLGKKLSVFIALAPAVYAGPLTTGFPFTTLNRLEWGMWKRFFGVLDFIPLMRWAYDFAPAKLFAMLGYTMFAFLFSWTDTNWLPRRKTKMFRFTPTPVSSASIFWWCGKGGFADRKCTLDDSLERWFDARFPPLSIYYGGRDFLVLTDPLLERLEKKEKDVRVVKVTKLDQSEHCDFYWAAEAVEWAYESFVDDIERTRPKDGEGDDTQDRREWQNNGQDGAQGQNDGRGFRRDPRVGLD